MGPRQHNMRGHRTDHNSIVADAGDALIGGPVVGYQLRLRGHGIKHEGMDLLLSKALDRHCQLKQGRGGILLPSVARRFGAEKSLAHL
jgi:hypothetical protein